MAAHESMSPTAAGMNITGMMAMRNVLVSRISVTFIHFIIKQMNSNTIPYILAGIGSGMKKWSSSPMKVKAIIMMN